MEEEVLYCPTCKKIVEDVLFCRIGGMYDISPPEFYVHCCTCGDNEVYYVKPCVICGSAEDAEHGICRSCREKYGSDELFSGDAPG